MKPVIRATSRVDFPRRFKFMISLFSNISINLSFPPLVYSAPFFARAFSISPTDCFFYVAGFLTIIFSLFGWFLLYHKHTSYFDIASVNILRRHYIITLYCSFYENPANTDELLDQFELTEKKNDFVKRLSGGQRQKLAIILALIGNPQSLVLDEISTGLDPHARGQIWGKIKNLPKNVKPVLA